MVGQEVILQPNLRCQNKKPRSHSKMKGRVYCKALKVEGWKMDWLGTEKGK